MKLGELLPLLTVGSEIVLCERPNNTWFSSEILNARSDSPVFEYYAERKIDGIGITADKNFLITLAK